MPISEERRGRAKKILLAKGIPLVDEMINVPEFSMITRGFEQDKRPLHSEVSNCILLEICNRSPDKKRTKFSLTHIPQSMAYAEQEELNNIIARSVGEFGKIGGNIDEAQIRIYGGNSESHLYSVLRGKIEGAIQESTGKTTASPAGHTNRKYESTEYYFFEDSIIFIKDDIRRIGPEDGIIATSKILHKDDDLTRLQKVDAFADYHNAVVKNAHAKEYHVERKELNGKIVDDIKSIKRLALTEGEKLKEIQKILPKEFLDISQVTRLRQDSFGASKGYESPTTEEPLPRTSPELGGAAAAHADPVKGTVGEKLYL